MTGATDGVALAEVAGLAVAEEAAWACSELFLLVAPGFLQPVNPSAKTRERIANLVTINAVRAFSLGRKNYKRFLARRDVLPKNLWRVSRDALMDGRCPYSSGFSLGSACAFS